MIGQITPWNYPLMMAVWKIGPALAAGNTTGQTLVTHPDVDMVSLTGSIATGKWIAKHAADTLKRAHLELGGKAPVVVFDDVELETALATIAGTGYYNAGQGCTAATRVLAGPKIHDDLVAGWWSDLSIYSLEDYTEVKHVMVSLGLTGSGVAVALPAGGKARLGIPGTSARARR